MGVPLAAAAAGGKAAAWKGVAAGAASAAGTGLFGWIGAKKARKHARNMATTAYQRDVEMWERANEYNTPMAQRKRLEEAGLNPALMYGSAPQNVATQTPKHQSYGTPTYTFNPANALSILGQFQDIKGKQLSNEQQSITNSFLNEKLFYETGKKGGDWFKSMVETERKKGGKSRYERKYQAEVETKETQRDLQNIQKQFLQKIPKEWQWITPLFMQLIKR